MLHVQPVLLCQAWLPSAPAFPGFILPCSSQNFTHSRAASSREEKPLDSQSWGGFAGSCQHSQLQPRGAQPWDDTPKTRDTTSRCAAALSPGRNTRPRTGLHRRKRETCWKILSLVLSRGAVSRWSKYPSISSSTVGCLQVSFFSLLILPRMDFYILI